MSGRPTRDTEWAVHAYEAARHRLPQADFPGAPIAATGLAEIIERYDALLLDAFGVLNVGETAIAGASEVIADAQRQGKRTLVLTNGATHPPEVAQEKYTRMGFTFSRTEVIASRDALRVGLHERPEEHWGVMAIAASRIEELGIEGKLLGDDPADYASCDGFILLGSGAWTDARQRLLVDALETRRRAVLVGNPDIVAPREYGLSLEPGHYAHALANAGLVDPGFFGKPFGNIYELAFERLEGIPHNRILMIGDTLHTDVLGGACAGVDTLLLTEHGLFAGRDANHFIQMTGIVPTWIAPGL